MRAEVLAVGSELTGGITVNTNAAWLSRRLAEAGIACARHTALPDDRTLLPGAIRDILQRCEVLILTGGLGPTFDDITMEAVAEALNRPLAPSASAASAIRRFYVRRHRRLQSAALRQARLPRGGLALPNPLGTAPGLWMELEGQVVVALPGVPAEMRAIMEASVLPRLRALPGRAAIEGCTLRTAGLVELDIQRVLERLRIPREVSIGLYPSLRMVDIRLTTSAPTRRGARTLLEPQAAAIRRALGLAVYGAGADTLEAVLGAWLAKHRQTLAVAESCTGGRILDRLTNVPGSSRYLLGGVVAYDNAVKRRLLGVAPETLRCYGAVSRQTAAAMAEGIRQAAGADVGLSVTGIAGPSGGTADKPVGLVWFGLSHAGGLRTLRRRFAGDRSAIKAQAAQTALNWLRLSLTVSGPAARTAHP